MKNAWKKWIGKRIQKLRESKDMSQDEVAQKLGKKRCTYASYEEGRAEPSACTIKQLCLIHSLSIEQFFEGSPEVALETCC